MVNGLSKDFVIFRVYKVIGSFNNSIVLPKSVSHEIFSANGFKCLENTISIASYGGISKYLKTATR